MEDRNRVASPRSKAPPRPTVAPGNARRRANQVQQKQDRVTSRQQVKEREQSDTQWDDAE